ncbi:MAG: hypothetical protein Q8N36_01625, partial [bacterium]|nr:hypothetical protein [bacterium]
CLNNMNFTFVHINSLPQLVISPISVVTVGESIYRLCAAISNTGFLPTSGSELAAKDKLAPPITAIIHLSQGSLLQGAEQIEVDHLLGHSEKKVEWLISAPSGTDISIEAKSSRAGKALAKIRI